MKIVIQCQKVDQLAHRLVGWKWRLGTVFWQGPVQVLPPYLAPHLVIKWIVRMLYSSFVWLIILADGKISKYWFRRSLPRSIYSISILLLEFIFPFVRPSEYIIIPEVCAQGWYSGSTPVLFVEFGSFFLTFSSYYPHISALFWRIYNFLSNLQIFLLNLRTFLSIFVTTDVYALPLKFLKSLPADFFPHLVWAKFWVPLLTSLNEGLKSLDD